MAAAHQAGIFSFSFKVVLLLRMYRKRQSRETESTSISPVSEKTVKLSVADLETRLSTDRALDVFTMQPMACHNFKCIISAAQSHTQPVRLQMNLPSLTYTREIRSSVDVVMSFTPRATGVEIVHRHSHIFILTDLFLVCERMTPGERTAAGPDGPDMFLCYPPLAGKHLRVIETSVSGWPNLARGKKSDLTLF